MSVFLMRVSSVKILDCVILIHVDAAYSHCSYIFSAILKSLNHQNVQVFKDIKHCFFSVLISTFFINVQIINNANESVNVCELLCGLKSILCSY